MAVEVRRYNHDDARWETPMATLPAPIRPRRSTPNFASRSGSKAFLHALDAMIGTIRDAAAPDPGRWQDGLLGLAAAAERAGACDAVRDRIRAALIWLCRLDGPCSRSEALDRLLDVRVAAAG
jgi:hypothetical protein